MSIVREGERAPPRIVNCGTLLAVAGLGVFVFLAYVLFQILCSGPGGAVPTPRYPA